jgi:hypothetical protein
VLGIRLIEHRGEKALRHLGHQQTLAVLGEDGHVPYRVVDVEPHKPAKQEVIIELLHQKPLAAHRISTCKSSARSSFSGAVDSRPLLAFTAFCLRSRRPA